MMKAHFSGLDDPEKCLGEVKALIEMLEMGMNRLNLLVLHKIDLDGSISGKLASDVYHARTLLIDLNEKIKVKARKRLKDLDEIISIMGRLVSHTEIYKDQLFVIDPSAAGLTLETDESSDEETDESYHEETDESSDEETDESYHEETDESSDEETDESSDEDSVVARFRRALKGKPDEETDESSDEKTDEEELWEDAWDESDSYTRGKGYTLYIKFIECGRPLPSGDNYAIYHRDGGTRASWDEKSIHFKEHYLFMCRSYALYIKNGGTRASWDEKSNKYKNNYLYPSCRHPHCHRM